MQSDQQKYEILFTKDQEMTQFIDSFDKLKHDEEEKMTEKQASIKRFLESISATLALSVAPDSHMRDVEDELDFKSKQLQNSETTQNRLEAELQKRQGELEKIESLDTKISQELQQVETKMRAYEDEISGKFDKVLDMQSQGQNRQQTLAQRKAFLDERLQSFQQQVSFLKLKVDSRKQQLTDDEVAQGLEAQEQKIRQFGQTLHTLNTFIRQKTAESNYEPELATVVDLTAQLNKMHMERRPLPAC
mmetsp:Transcript_8457/g.21629  ORF Transcript_8457/g.21629 Transcript_8457/m.21629 type:complete len:247 (+) Transcript_8457:134-874(+)